LDYNREGATVNLKISDMHLKSSTHYVRTVLEPSVSISTITALGYQICKSQLCFPACVTLRHTSSVALDYECLLAS
jgi:hypothetical protein